MPKLRDNAPEPFINLCEKLSNDIADMIEHPECPEPLQLHLIEIICNLSNKSKARLDVRRAEVEARYLLPLYLRKYTDEIEADS